MGYESHTTNYRCGCKHHYSYDEACGMGPIRGTEKSWWEYCEEHQRRAWDIDQAIANLKHAKDQIHEEARGSGRA